MINNDFQQIPVVVGASVVVEVGSKEKIDTVQLWKKVLDSKETYLSIDNYNKDLLCTKENAKCHIRIHQCIILYRRPKFS